LLSDEFEVVAAVENGQDAVNAVCRLLPDVLVLDMTMPVLNGLEVARHLTNAGSTTKITMPTFCEDTACVSAAFAAGVRGYVFKHMILADLIPAIRAVVEGQTFTSSAVRL
jgi:DNA-binding NarL/FixJ family response regulator